jgi:hypothetical protein
MKKSSHFSDNSKAVKKETLADGTRVHELKETQTLADGSLIIKERTSRTFPQSQVSLKKSIKTSITRTDPDGVCTTTTTEELITAPNTVAAEPSSTKAQVLPNGSRIITTKTSNVLSDGSISSVVTKIHMNKSSSQDVQHPFSAHNDVAASRPEMISQDTPRMDVLSSNQPVLPPGFHSSNNDDYDARLKRKEAQHRQTPRLELVGSNDGAVVPPGVEMVVGANSRPKQLNSKELKSSRIETIDNGSEEPIPMSFHASSAMQPLVGVALMDSKQPPMIDTEHLKTSRLASALETIDNHSDEPIPMNFHKTTITEQSKLLDVETGPMNCSAQTLDDYLKPEQEEKEGRHTFGSSSRGLSGFMSNSAANLAVATPVLDDVDKPVYEATAYEATTPIYKTRKCMALTLMLLVVIGVVVGAVVATITKNTEVKLEKTVITVTSPPTSAPTLAPTTERDVILAHTIESTILKRNATFGNMSENDPRLRALEWIQHTDQMQLGTTDPNLIQRYTLALMAFQLDYTVWNNEPNSTSNETAEDDAGAMSDEVINWLSGEDVCEWYGVKCKDGMVTEIHLCKFSYNCGDLSVHTSHADILDTCIFTKADNQMIGKIPPEIGNLDSLEKLDLSYNCKS